MTAMTDRRTWVVLSCLVLLCATSCGGPTDATADHSEKPTAVSPSDTVASPSPTGVVPLPDGDLEPGRYRFVVSTECEGVEDDPIACPDGVPDPPPIPLEVSVPDGWEHPAGFPVVWTVNKPEGEDAALVLGWTSNTVGVQSDPCLSENHQLPDIAVGPSVDDFVDTVTSQRWYEGSAPVETQVGGVSGRYFTLTGPEDLSPCEEWRPWDPGFFAQGPSNIWEVWVLDVRDHRVLVVIDYFPGTSKDVVAELRRMVESIEFPSA